MNNSNLGILERLFIILRCHKDIRRHRFVEFEYSNADGITRSVFISPFVTTELAYFLTERMKTLVNKITLLNVSESKSLFGIRFFRAPKAICKIDELITETEHQISSEKECFDDTISILQDMHNRYIENNATHHAQLCMDKITKTRTEMQKKKKKLQKRLITFANEKVRIISIVNAKINDFKAHRIMRIQYYYGCACLHFKKLPVTMYTLEDLECVAGERIGTEHTGILKAAQQKVAEITNATTERSSDENASV